MSVSADSTLGSSTSFCFSLPVVGSVFASSTVASETFASVISTGLVLLVSDLTEPMSEHESALFIPSLYSSISAAGVSSAVLLLKVSLTSTRTVRLRADLTGFFNSYLRANDSSPDYNLLLEVVLTSSEKDFFIVAALGAPVEIVTGISSLRNSTCLFLSIFMSTLFLGLIVYQSVLS